MPASEQKQRQNELSSIRTRPPQLAASCRAVVGSGIGNSNRGAEGYAHRVDGHDGAESLPFAPLWPLPSKRGYGLHGQRRSLVSIDVWLYARAGHLSRASRPATI